jgi:hypothetical protein
MSIAGELSYLRIEPDIGSLALRKFIDEPAAGC